MSIETSADPRNAIAAALCVVDRPGMSPYRARLKPGARYWVEDDGRIPTYWVTVYRTHDLDVAVKLAHDEMRAHGETGDTLSAGELVWLRRHPESGGQAWARVESSKRGAIPCVVFKVEEA